MSGSEGEATVPEAGDHRGSVQDTAPQQPATGPRRPDTSANINTAPQGSTNTLNRGAHASLDGMQARQTSPFDQHLTHNTYGHDGSLLQNNVNTPNPSTYHFYEGAQPSFQNSFTFDNHPGQQQYQPPQTRANPANQHGSQLNSTWSWTPTLPRMPADEEELEFFDTAKRANGKDFGHLLPKPPSGSRTRPANASSYSGAQYGFNYSPNVPSPLSRMFLPFPEDFQIFGQYDQGDEPFNASAEDTQPVVGNDGMSAGTSYGYQGSSEGLQLPQATGSNYVAPKTTQKRRKTNNNTSSLRSNIIETTEQSPAPKKERSSSDASIPTKTPLTQTSKKRGRKQSDEQQPSSQESTFDLGDIEPRGMSIERALAITTLLIDLKIARTDDDVQDVKAQLQDWVKAIMEALCEPYSPTPLYQDYGAVLPEFEPWQAENWQNTKARLTDPRYPDRLEACATVLFHKVVQCHENRGLKECGLSFKLDPTLSCSRRLKAIFAAIQQSAIVRWDIATGQRLDELIGNPLGVVKTKEANKLTNEKKKEKYKHVVKKGGVKTKKKASDGEQHSSSQDISSEAARLPSSSPEDGDERKQAKDMAKLLGEPYVSPTFSGEVSEENEELEEWELPE